MYCVQFYLLCVSLTIFQKEYKMEHALFMSCFNSKKEKKKYVYLVLVKHCNNSFRSVAEKQRSTGVRKRR